MVRASAGFKHHLGWLLLGKEAFHLAALEFAPRHRALVVIDPMQREPVLGRINRDALKLHPDGAWLLIDNSTLARDAVGPSTPTVNASVAWYEVV